MGAAKKIGAVILAYVIIALIWSVMRHMEIIPLEPGGLDGPLNILYMVFDPISIIYFMIINMLAIPVPL
ncbi:MAG: hypothetical protein ACFFAY_11565 [Promethearchaeota archaeon]